MHVYLSESCLIMFFGPFIAPSQGGYIYIYTHTHPGVYIYIYTPPPGVYIPPPQPTPRGGWVGGYGEKIYKNQYKPIKKHTHTQTNKQTNKTQNKQIKNQNVCPPEVSRQAFHIFPLNSYLFKHT